jgi:hypothetical protein
MKTKNKHDVRERRSISLYYDVFKEKMIKFRYVDGGSGKKGKRKKKGRKI